MESNVGRNDIKPSVWGPYFWATLHAMSDGAPFEPTGQEREGFLNVLKALPHILPCEKCRLHVTAYISENTPSYVDRDELRIWIWELHNKVNATLSKKIEPFECCSKSYKSVNSIHIFTNLCILTVVFLAMIIIAYTVNTVKISKASSWG